MPDITIKNTLSGTSNAAAVMENFYEPDASTPDTLEVINGWLDSDNKTATLWSRRVIQPRSFTVAGAVGCTVARDYYASQFGDSSFYADINDGADPATTMSPVAGSEIRFYLPWATTGVLFTWSASWGADFYEAQPSDAVTPGAAAVLQFRVDDAAWTAPGSQRRAATTSVFMHPTADVPFRPPGRDNIWCGHQWVPTMSKGWHHAALYIGVSAVSGGGVAGATVDHQARVRNAAMRYIAFR